MRKLILVTLLLASLTPAQNPPRKINPTWLRRDTTTLREHPTDISTPTCHYTPIFGESDADASSPQTFTRFGLLTIDPHGSCQTAAYPRLEELYFVLDAAPTAQLQYGTELHPLAANDFTYIPPTVSHALRNNADQPLRLILVTAKLPAKTQIAPAPNFAIANLRDLQEQTVGGHPTSVLYKLMIGPRVTRRDRINATYTIADFFLMDFAPAGTNFPHHHENAEEIYLVLDGEGQMSAGSGTDGIEGLHPAKSGDAYFFRVNCTVGFYNAAAPDAKAHILAVRAYVPPPTDLD